MLLNAIASWSHPRHLPLTGAGRSLQFGATSPEVKNREQVRGTMADEPRESLEAVRLEKVHRIAAMGLDPWGRRFDGHQAISDVRALPVPVPSEGAVEPP